MAQLPDSAAIEAALNSMAIKVAELCNGVTPLVAGVANGGLHVSKRLHPLLQAHFSETILLGSINPTFHRDDIGANPIPLSKGRTNLHGGTAGKTVVLVDDVFESGRTARAALEEVFANGRPEKVILAVLCERPGRCLPLRPDVSCFEINTELDGKLRLSLDPDGPSETDGFSVK